MMLGQAQDTMAKSDARGVRQAAKGEHDAILREMSRVRSAARAATAGSGVVVDEFAMQFEDEITRGGTYDATMALLTGEQRARSMELEGRMARRAGNSAMASSLLDAGTSAVGGWKGAKHREDYASHTDRLRGNGMGWAVGRGLGD